MNLSPVHTFTSDTSLCGMLSINHVTQSSCKASAVRTWWALPGAALQFVVYSLIEFSTIHVSANYAYSAGWLLVCPLLQALQRPHFRLASAPAGSTGLLAPVYLVLPGCWPQPLVYLLCFILGKISEFWYHFYFSEKLQEPWEELLQTLIRLFAFLLYLLYLLYHSLSHLRGSWRCRASLPLKTPVAFFKMTFSHLTTVQLTQSLH